MGWLALMPETLVIGAAILALFAEFLPGGDRSAARVGVLATGLAAVLVVTRAFAVESPFGGMLVFDTASTFVRTAVSALTCVFLLWVAGRGFGLKREREAVFLTLFAALGGMVIASAANLVVLYMGLEAATMPAYVLVGYRRRDRRSLEGALKYFLMSVLTSLLMVYGFSFLYGLSGSASYSALDVSSGGGVALAAALLVAVGFSAKLSAVPFHFWAPDAYEGAPVASVAFVSSIPKVAALAAFARLVGALAPGVPSLGTALAVLAAVSMIVGNIAAYAQTDLRRLMAYSGIAHSGYLLLALSAGTPAGGRAAVFYAVAYGVPSMAVMLLSAEEGVDLRRISGLASRRPLAAWAMVVFLLSLVGVPPLAGFFGKLSLLGAALDSGRKASVALAVLMSVVSAGYYSGIVRAMFFGEGVTRPPVARSEPASALAVVLMLAVTVALGVAAAPVLASLAFSPP